MGASVSSTWFGPPWCLQQLKVEAAAAFQGALCPTLCLVPNPVQGGSAGESGTLSPTQGRRNGGTWTLAVS